jgi:hypothetical protein
MIQGARQSLTSSPAVFFGDYRKSEAKHRRSATCSNNSRQALVRSFIVTGFVAILPHTACLKTYNSKQQAVKSSQHLINQ